MTLLTGFLREAEKNATEPNLGAYGDVNCLELFGGELTADLTAASGCNGWRWNERATTESSCGFRPLPVH